MHLCMTLFSSINISCSTIHFWTSCEWYKDYRDEKYLDDAVHNVEYCEKAKLISSGLPEEDIIRLISKYCKN